MARPLTFTTRLNPSHPASPGSAMNATSEWMRRCVTFQRFSTIRCVISSSATSALSSGS
jgi:hypothetical protein